jgi:hypothetical protein
MISPVTTSSASGTSASHSIHFAVCMAVPSSKDFQSRLGNRRRLHPSALTVWKTLRGPLRFEPTRKQTPIPLERTHLVSYRPQLFVRYCQCRSARFGTTNSHRSSALSGAFTGVRATPGRRKQENTWQHAPLSRG